MKKSKILLLIIFLLSNLIYSETGPDFDDNVVDSAPIDGWVYVIIVAGVYYGYKKIIINSKAKSVNKES